MKEYLTPREVAEKLGLTVRTVQNYAKAKKIGGATLIGSRWRFRIVEFEKWQTSTSAGAHPSSTRDYVIPGNPTGSRDVPLSAGAAEKLEKLRALSKRRSTRPSLNKPSPIATLAAYRGSMQ